MVVFESELLSSFIKLSCFHVFVLLFSLEEGSRHVCFQGRSDVQEAYVEQRRGRLRQTGACGNDVAMSSCLLQVLGIAEGVAHVNRSVAKKIPRRVGVRKCRHMEVKLYWLEGLVREESVCVRGLNNLVCKFKQRRR